MKIEYKLKSEKEDVNYYNKQATKLKTKYILTIKLPCWVSMSYVFNLFPVKPKKNEDVAYIKTELENDGLRSRNVYDITFYIHTLTVCRKGDTFDETKGLHICETKAEIKALETVEKFMDKIKDNIKLNEDYKININRRKGKNIKNLNRLCS